MMMKIGIGVALVAVLGSCGNAANNKNRPAAYKTKKQDSATAHQVSASRRSGDTLLIYSRAAVSLWADSDRVERLKKRDGDDFEEGASDFAYYAVGSDSVLQKLKLPIISADSCHYLKFVQQNGAITLIKTDTLQELYTLYFFDPSRRPRSADISGIKDDYKAYYEKGL